MILNLTLKKQWFDMILSGEKTEEYREIKQYWANRLLWHEYHEHVSCINSLKDTIEYALTDQFSSGVFRRDLEFVEFKNGYQKNARSMIVELTGITYGEARADWSGNWQGEVFILKLGRVLSTKNIT